MSSDENDTREIIERNCRIITKQMRTLSFPSFPRDSLFLQFIRRQDNGNMKCAIENFEVRIFLRIFFLFFRKM